MRWINKLLIKLHVKISRWALSNASELELSLEEQNEIIAEMNEMINSLPVCSNCGHRGFTANCDKCIPY